MGLIASTFLVLLVSTLALGPTPQVVNLLQSGVPVLVLCNNSYFGAAVKSLVFTFMTVGHVTSFVWNTI